MHRIAVVVLALALGCSDGPPHAQSQPATVGNVDAPRVLLGGMLTALTREDTSAWQALLSQRVRAQLGGNPDALYAHLAAWRRDLLPLAPAIEHALVAVDVAGVVTYSLDGDTPHVIASVAMEGGALRLDEN